MLVIAFLLAQSTAQANWALPHAGITLGQNEITYFRDVVLVEVSVSRSREVDREVTTAAGKLTLHTKVQDVRIVDSNFGASGSVQLVFTPPLPTTQATGRPGWIGMPLAPGRYLATGRSPESGAMAAHPGASLYGMKDEAASPPVGRTFVASHASDEFAVFHILPTKRRTLANKAASPEAVLENLVAAAEESDAAGRSETFDLLLRTNHGPFGWREAAVGPAKRLSKFGRASHGDDAVFAWLASFHMGDWSIEMEMLEALVQAGNERPDEWGGLASARVLRLARVNPALPSPEAMAKLDGKPRQMRIFGLMERTESDPIRTFLVTALGGYYSSEMNAGLLSMLNKALAGSPFAEALVTRLEVWLGDSATRDERSRLTPAQLLEYWKGRLGRG